MLVETVPLYSLHISISIIPRFLISLFTFPGAFRCLESTNIQLSTEESRCFHSSGKTPIYSLHRAMASPPPLAALRVPCGKKNLQKTISPNLHRNLYLCLRKPITISIRFLENTLRFTINTLLPWQIQIPLHPFFPTSFPLGFREEPFISGELEAREGVSRWPTFQLEGVKR